MSEKFYQSRPNAKGEYSEYYLLDEEMSVVERRGFQLVPHESGLKPKILPSEQIEGFLLKDVDTKAKNALLDFLERKNGRPR